MTSHYGEIHLLNQTLLKQHFCKAVIQYFKKIVYLNDFSYVVAESIQLPKN